jgi:hypothetical protein
MGAFVKVYFRRRVGKKANLIGFSSALFVTVKER